MSRKQTKLSEPVPGTWDEVVRPLAERFRLGAFLGQDVTYNPKGSEALAYILTEMARIIDEEIVARHKRQMDKT